MRIPLSKSRRRAAFTLIELLVVIAIIAVLAALTAGALFRLSASQNLKRSEATVKKVQTGFDSQWKAAVDDAKEDIKNHKVKNVAAAFAAAAVTDSDTANELYVLMKVKIEFPQTFEEARNPGLNAFGLLPKAVYTQEVQNFNIEPDPPGLAPQIREARQKESAVLLFLVLSQTRRGATFNVDEMGGSVKVFDVNVRNLGTNVVSQRQFKVIVDAWGTPITFDRFTLDAGLAQEMTTIAGGKNPQDPFNKLVNMSAAQKKYFSNLLTYVPNQNLFEGLYHGPVIRSAGPDRSYLTPTDDIIGFRLMAEGQRGN